MPSSATQWRLRPAQKVALALEAAAWLAVAGAAVRVLPFARLAAGLCAGHGERADRSHRAAALVGWAVTTASSRAPWRMRCFERGLAAHAMLRRRGLQSVLYYGAAGAGGLRAHVWVRCAGVDVVGGDEAPDFAVLARFS